MLENLSRAMAIMLFNLFTLNILENIPKSFFIVFCNSQNLFQVTKIHGPNSRWIAQACSGERANSMNRIPGILAE